MVAREVKVVSVAAIIAVQRRRPVVTVAISAVGFRAVAIARSGKENAITVGAGYFITIYAVLGGPIPGTIVE